MTTERHGKLGTGWLLILLTLSGCATTVPMMPTPALYTGDKAKPLIVDLPAEHRTPPLDLFYITDRGPAAAGEKLPYNADRSRSIAFGSTIVQFGEGEGVNWDTLIQQSTKVERNAKVEMTLGPTREMGRFPPAPYAVIATPQGLTRAPALIDLHLKTTQALQADLARRLAGSPRKEIVMYVHGYANTFEDAALAMGQLCHFLGRDLVCGIFTWPAGGTRGIFFGYNVDVESSAFAVEDLRKTIRMVAGTPGLQKLHLMAHSRGTDVLSTALSELSVEAYMQQGTLHRQFKINNIVLMAPDIDVDVAAAKIFKILSDPELPFGKAAAPRATIEPSPDFKLTVYASPDDKALATSSWLFGSIARLGAVDSAMLTPQQIEMIHTLKLFDMIQVRGGSADLIGHGYFHSNPRVSSDIVALLRYGLKPNEPGRPLEEVKRPFWRVKTDAPK